MSQRGGRGLQVEAVCDLTAVPGNLPNRTCGQFREAVRRLKQGKKRTRSTDGTLSEG